MSSLLLLIFSYIVPILWFEVSSFSYTLIFYITSPKNKMQHPLIFSTSGRPNGVKFLFPPSSQNVLWTIERNDLKNSCFRYEKVGVVSKKNIKYSNRFITSISHYHAICQDGLVCSTISTKKLVTPICGSGDPNFWDWWPQFLGLATPIFGSVYPYLFKSKNVID